MNDFFLNFVCCFCFSCIVFLMMFKLCAHRVLAVLLPALVVVLLHVLVVLLLHVLVLLLHVGANVSASCVGVAILKHLQAQNLLLFSRWCCYLHWCCLCFLS
jgi:hypothetical protein